MFAKRWVVIVLVCLTLPTACIAQEIEFVEDFALAADRESALTQLVPGTETYYYYHCLHYQNTQQFDKVDQMLEPWIKRLGRTALVKQIQNRQALLTYEQNPQATLEYLRENLGLRFDHQREIPQAERDLPSRLDQSLISFDTLAARAFKAHRNTDGFETESLAQIASRSLNKTQLQHLLARLERPDLENLAELVSKQLRERDAKPFGSMPIHGMMTKSQLDQLLELEPKLLNQQAFVQVYLSKLWPGADVDWQRDDEAHLAYLERLWQFIQRLDPVHNSLKAHVLYRRLKFDQRHGTYDKGRFVNYLKLPRQVGYINPEMIKGLQQRQHLANLGTDFLRYTMFAPIRTDENLVANYLQHFLNDASDYQEFLPWIRDDFLRFHFAEVKIVNGLGDREQWASLLTPAQFQTLMNRVDLDFALTNPREFAVDQSISIDLFIKNVDKLIVKVFEINAENYYRQMARPIDTDINLDGLIPNWQETFTFDDAPLRRVKRHFELDSIVKPGVYVVDFIGNGKSSRALIRKGRLHYVIETTFGGQRFTVFDETDAAVDDARLWMAGRWYEPGDDGTIMVPFSTQPKSENAIIRRGNLTTLARFEHQAESYQLVAGMFVDREALLRNKTATLLIRPSLLISGSPAPLTLLKETSLTINSVDLDDVQAFKEAKDLELSSGEETAFEFRVPDRLKTVEFLLTGTVRNISTGQDQSLSVSQKVKINGIDATGSTRDVHLVRSPKGFQLEVRGKTGEPLERAAVLVSCKHRLFKSPVQASLQTDAQGTIWLGPLTDIDSIEATHADVKRSWPLVADQNALQQTLHIREGQPVSIPYTRPMQKPTRSDFALLEKRGNTYFADHFKAISIADGLVQIKGLGAGDYQLILKRTNQQVLIRVTKGSGERLAVSNKRILEQRAQRPLHIKQVTSNDETLSVTLGNPSQLTRVHVLATRNAPRFDAFSVLGKVRDVEPYMATKGVEQSSYVEGRDIGDELRYILDRRSGNRFPGNMLRRPSLLLNPWALRTTENQVQSPDDGTEFARKGGMSRSNQQRAQATTTGPGELVDPANIDFLDEGTTLLSLSPDENGVVVIDRESLGAKHDITIVAVDPYSTLSRQITLQPVETKILDLRLNSGLDPDTHFAQRKEHSILDTGDTLQVSDMSSSRIQIFDDLADVYRLFMANSNNNILAQFGFVLDWPNKSEEEKRKLYSEHACHELSYFIYKKDREFFDNVVRPYLQNKRSRTFVDFWLLDNDLHRFESPWQYNRLNIVEQILLSQRLTSRRDIFSRHVLDQYEIKPTPRQQFDQLYDLALFSNSLDFTTQSWSQFSGQEAVYFSKLHAIPREAPPVTMPRPEGEARETLNAALDIEPGQSQGDGKAQARDATRALRNMLDGGSSRHRQLQTARARGEKLGKAGKDIGGGEVADLAGVEATIAGGVRVQRLDEIEAILLTGDPQDVAKVRKSLEKLYRRLEPTQEWAENHYYHVPIEQQTAELVTVNRFWRDYSQHAAEATFLSPYFPEASGNFTEMMLALSVLDLPFEPDEHESEITEQQLDLTAGSPMIVFHQEVRPAIFARHGSSVLVSENFFRNDDRYQHDGERKYDKFVTNEFLSSVLYGGQVVVTNPTSTPQATDLLIQIPQGAMPVSGAKQTRTIQMDLAAFSTQTYEYFFYFPEPGQFTHYPAHVAVDQRVVAVADPIAFNVAREPSSIDTSSWTYISQNGTDDQVLEFLNSKNLLHVNLEKIAFRMKQSTFFEQVIDALANRQMYSHTLWSYAVTHNSAPALTEFLMHADQFVSQCGAYLQSQLVTIDPTERRWYEHREYRPLVNARAHALGPRRKILNDRFHEQYHQLLQMLACRQTLDSDDHLAITYYMLLQDRIEEALGHFDLVNSDSLPSRLQYDYCTAYLAMYRDKTEKAEQIALRYADYTVPRWRDLFQTMLSQIKETRGEATQVIDKDDQLQSQTKLAANAPSFDFSVESRKIKIDYQNLTQVVVNYYEMDVELLFSRSPFSQRTGSRASLVRPGQQVSIDLPSDQSSFEIDLPADLHSSNVIVEIAGGGQTKSQAYYAHSLSVRVIENYGQLVVRHEEDERPLPKVYVKVYAQKNDGTIAYYKDGYTDLRGRFDYASLNNQDMGDVSQLAILVLSDEHGAMVRETAAPKE